MDELSAIEAALKSVTEGKGCPAYVWHPNFGWILVNGKPTEYSSAYLKWLGSLGSNQEPSG